MKSKEELNRIQALRRRMVYHALKHILTQEDLMRALWVLQNNFLQGVEFTIFDYVDRLDEMLRLGQTKRDIRRLLSKCSVIQESQLDPDPIEIMQHYALLQTQKVALDPLSAGTVQASNTIGALLGLSARPEPEPAIKPLNINAAVVQPQPVAENPPKRDVRENPPSAATPAPVANSAPSKPANPVPPATDLPRTPTRDTMPFESPATAALSNAPVHNGTDSVPQTIAAPAPGSTAVPQPSALAAKSAMAASAVTEPAPTTSPATDEVQDVLMSPKLTARGESDDPSLILPSTPGKLAASAGIQASREVLTPPTAAKTTGSEQPKRTGMPIPGVGASAKKLDTMRALNTTSAIGVGESGDNLLTSSAIPLLVDYTNTQPAMLKGEDTVMEPLSTESPLKHIKKQLGPDSGTFVFNYLLRNIIQEMKKHGGNLVTLNRQLLSEIPEMGLSEKAFYQLIEWCHGRSNAILLGSNDAEHMRSILHAIYIWLCHEYGPAEADRIYSEVFSKANQLPQSLEFPADELL